MSEPSKEAMERALQYVRVEKANNMNGYSVFIGVLNAAWEHSELQAKTTGNRIAQAIARAIDAAVMEERAAWEAQLEELAAAHELLDRGVYPKGTLADRITALVEDALAIAVPPKGKQLCGHPTACIVSTGEGTNHCAWCESEAKALYWHAKCVEGGLNAD